MHEQSQKLGLSMHNYHDTYKALPPALKGANGLVWAHSILAYIEQTALAAKVSHGTAPDSTYTGTTSQRYDFIWPTTATTTAAASYDNIAAFKQENNVPGFHCPSDNPGYIVPTSDPTAVFREKKLSNYMIAMGNNAVYYTDYVPPEPNFWIANFVGTNGTVKGGGAFFSGFNQACTRGSFLGLESASDGTSNTLMTGEVIKGGTCPNSSGVHRQDTRGMLFRPGGQAFITTYNTPNSKLPDKMFYVTCRCCNQPEQNLPCIDEDKGAPGDYGYMAARSRHTGGVNGGLGDGSVTFFSDTISITIWRALGSAKGGESVSF